MIHIAIFEEHKLLIDGLNRLFEGLPDIRLVASCTDRNELSEKLKKNAVHVLAMHLNEIDMRNLNLIIQLNISFPKVRILVISATQSEDTILKTIKAGAKGFLGKASDRNELLEAIYTLRNGHDYLSKSITGMLLNQYVSKLSVSEHPEQQEASSLLSARQMEILRYWSEGFSNQEMAERLFISVRTVETHKNHIMQKLNFKSTVDMVKFAIKNNIIEL